MILLKKLYMEECKMELETSQVNEVKNKCELCNKKVKITAVVCKCGRNLCSMHVDPQKHDCKFDYRRAARETLEKRNPVILPDKVDCC